MPFFLLYLFCAPLKIRGGGGKLLQALGPGFPWVNCCMYMVDMAGSEMFPYARSRRCISCRPCWFTVYIPCASVCARSSHAAATARMQSVPNGVFGGWVRGILLWSPVAGDAWTISYSLAVQSGSSATIVVSQGDLAIIPVGDCLWA